MLRKALGLSLPLVPKFIVGRVASRYVAGDSMDDAVRSARELESAGFRSTLALLGEEVDQRDKAIAATAEYVDLVERLAREDPPRADSVGLSIKLTLLGLKVDRELCRDNLERLLESAKPHGTFVRIDMEDHTCTDDTLELYSEMASRHDHVGIVLQAYLRRTLSDIKALPEGAKVRLCKGIYIEPRSVAYKDYDTVRAAFVDALELLFMRGAIVGVATHDEYLVSQADGLVKRYDLGPHRYEFQTLLGVDEPLRDMLRDSGHPLRVYVPYGKEWYEYSIRRLRENPQIAVYVLKAMLGRSG